MVVLRYTGVLLFIHHNSCGFGSPSCSLSDLSLSSCTPISPPAILSSFSHIYIGHYVCAFAWWHGPLNTRLSCTLPSSSSVSPLHESTLQPLDQPSLLPLSLSAREQMWTQKKYLWMSGTFGHYGVSLLLASTLSLSARPRSESRAVIMEIETPSERCVRLSLFLPFFYLPRSRSHSRLLFRGRVIMRTDKIARRTMRKMLFNSDSFMNKL